MNSDFYLGVAVGVWAAVLLVLFKKVQEIEKALADKE